MYGELTVLWLVGCIQAFAAADEGLRGYAAAVEGWKEELKEVRRVEDELKAVVRDKDILYALSSFYSCNAQANSRCFSHQRWPLDQSK